jgi:hypothetical protein
MPSRLSGVILQYKVFGSAARLFLTAILPLCHRERSAAIQSLSTHALDCFALLAMTKGRLAL